MKLDSNKGFTIVELLIVVVVIAILAAITLVAFNGVTGRAKVSSVLAAMRQGTEKIMLYATEHGDAYPATLADIGLTNSSSTTYQYEARNNGYCLTASTQDLTYFQTNKATTPIPGTCTGLIGWWPFNGDAIDLSGNAIDATVIGATLTNGQSGKPNSAYQLGESGKYINVGTPSALSVVPSKFTYSIWASYSSASTNQWPIIMGAPSSHQAFAIRTNTYGSKVYFEYGRSPFDNIAYSSLGSSTFDTSGGWHNVIVKYDGAVLSYYYDGVLGATMTASSLYSPMANFQFGTSGGSWVGKIDDARVYNRALTADEIATLYATGAQ